MPENKISWKPDRVKIGDLKAWLENPRMSTKAQAQRILKSLDKFGQVETLAIDAENNIINGHQRYFALMTIHSPEYEVDARRANRVLTDEEKKELTIALHTGATGSWNWQQLSGWDAPQLQEWGMDADALKDWNNDALNLKELLRAEQVTEDTEPQIDRAEELREKWGVSLGQMWALGEHRLICGDCTDKAVIEQLAQGEKFILVHADPPYGMGKEKDGVVNDNLYREKLDDFQKQWWKACRPFVADNGSAYIWGTAEDLWRLWYRSLKDSERLTVRNEIVWHKGSGQGMGSDAHRMYPTASERCLFFVIGEQGWNNNADNYWEGFTAIVDYLESQRAAMNWSIKDTKRIAGHSEKSGCHWFDKSQWTMPTEEVYNAWKAAAKGDGFRREYDELRREWYATRAPFDNTHELMTDVWYFDTMRGEERPDHPTPKPPKMIERIIKTSGTDDAPTLSPFIGSGTDIIAGENCGRKVYGCEISEKYCAVTLERYQQATGKTPVLIES